MNLPFVSRSVYEEQVRQNERLAALLKLALKPRRRKEAPEREPLQPAQSAIPAALEFSIEQRAGGDPFYRRYLTNFTQAELAKGTAEETILHRITYGDDEDDE